MATTVVQTLGVLNPYGSEGPASKDADSRLRHQNVAKKSKRGRDRRRGAAADRSTSVGDPSIEPLIVHSVVDATGLRNYIPALKRWILWVWTFSILVLTVSDIDRSLALWLLKLAYEDECHPHVGDCAVNGAQWIWPELYGCLPRAHRSLLGWHKIHIHGEGGPQPYPLLLVVSVWMREHGYHEEADALEISLDAFLRSSEWFHLVWQDVVFYLDETMLRLGVAERGESTKTGMRQGVRLDGSPAQKGQGQKTPG